MSETDAPRLPLGELSDVMAVGEPLAFNVLDSQGRLLLAAGQRLFDARQLATLIEREACANEAEVQAVRLARRAGDATAAAAPRQRTWFEQVEQQVWALDDLLRIMGRERPPTMAPRIEAFADGYIELVERHFDAALYLLVRQHDRRFALYALTHALHTATVCLLTARQLGWEAERQRCVVRAALTMNASIVDLQARMAEQNDAPSKKQLEAIHAHPHQSARLLRDCGVTDTEWLAAVEDHHERGGGAGYPRGLCEVGEVAHLLRAADVFTAKISPRALRAPLSPQVAARQLFQEEQGGPFAAALIRAIGVYPPGDWVSLKSGDIGIVVQRAVAGRGAVVVALIGANGKAVAGAPRRDTAQAEFTITGPLGERPGLPRVLAEQVYGLLTA
ncbi:MAG: phosphohydrolase [Leptothrix sp. (in: Bacteria)]|nr:phosphohydrolase [Leptothrix sp. (in: b-proteobacteria)]